MQIDTYADRRLNANFMYLYILILIVCDSPLGVVSNYIASDRDPRTAATVDNILYYICHYYRRQTCLVRSTVRSITDHAICN
jgi:hypothetical protein